MISKKEAEKVYPRNTEIIRKGDPGWTSDNHQEGRRGESYGSNPLSKIDQKIRQRNSREVDMNRLPSIDEFNVGDEIGIPMENERDVAWFRVVEHRTIERTMNLEDFERVRRQWKYVWKENFGCL